MQEDPQPMTPVIRCSEDATEEPAGKQRLADAQGSLWKLANPADSKGRQRKTADDYNFEFTKAKNDVRTGFLS